MFHVPCSMLIDTHAHVNFNAFKEDAEEVIKRSLEKEVFLVNVGSQYSTSVRAVKTAEKYTAGVWAAIGIHPLHLEERTFITNNDDPELKEDEVKSVGEIFAEEKYRELGKGEKVVAIGEVGLDYHHFQEGDDVEKMKVKQKEVLRYFIDLANELEKPMMIHCWDAYDDLLEIFQNKPVKKSGVIHSFVGGYKTANKFLEMGFLIGLNGVITYSDSFDRLIKEVPLSKMLLETDCPYLSPVPLKGQRNEPLYVAYVAEKIAQIKQVSPEEVAQATTQNAKKLFNL
jgi:TatD DNase family protein